jgi:hypothetical protein
MLTERGIRVCAPVHDAVLVEAPADRIDEITAETRAVMAEASGIVLGGPTLRSDAQTVRFPDRLLDDDSRAFWGRLTGYLGDAPFRAPERPPVWPGGGRSAPEPTEPPSRPVDCPTGAPGGPPAEAVPSIAGG